MGNKKNRDAIEAHVSKLITKDGVRIPFGNTSLTLSANIPKKEVGVKLTVPLGQKKKKK